MATGELKAGPNMPHSEVYVASHRIALKKASYKAAPSRVLTR